MSFDPKSLAPVLSTVGELASSASRTLPGAAGVVAGVIGAALGFAADLAKAGADPITHIQRIHAAEPLLKDVESEWAAALRRKFGGP